MSELIIKDGTGRGKRAKVDDDNRLQTFATTRGEVSAQLLEGNQYLIGLVGGASIATVDTEYPLVFINPNDPDLGLFPQRLTVSVLESTPITFRARFGAADPSANFEVASAGNASTASTKKASITVNRWDGVGTGMVIGGFGGIAAFTLYLQQGLTDLRLEGEQFWGFNSRILISAECSVANSVTVALSAWEAPPSG